MESTPNAQRGQSHRRRRRGRIGRDRRMNAHQRDQSIEKHGPWGPPGSEARSINDQLNCCDDYIESGACQVPITTRGIGFIVSRITSEVAQHMRYRYGNSEGVPVGAIYRLSLAQLELRIMDCQPDSGFANIINVSNSCDLFERISFQRRDCLRCLEDYPQNLSAIALVIDSIGNVTFNDKNFSPVFYKEESPFNLRIHNLRAYCDKMANRNTPLSKRMEGFELNSIPNARWGLLDENDPESFGLTNPDEIISSDYLENDYQGLERDQHIVEKFRWAAEFLHIFGSVQFNGQGNPSILVSTLFERGQSLALKNDVVSGNVTEFWAPDNIPQDSWKLGALALTGEVWNQDNCAARINVEGFRCFLNWRGLADYIL